MVKTMSTMFFWGKSFAFNMCNGFLQDQQNLVNGSDMEVIFKLPFGKEVKHPATVQTILTSRKHQLVDHVLSMDRGKWTPDGGPQYSITSARTSEAEIKNLDWTRKFRSACQ